MRNLTPKMLNLMSIIPLKQGANVSMSLFVEALNIASIFEKFVSRCPPFYTFLLFLTHFIHTSFTSLHYLQVKRTAMGTRMAPFYANLFKGYLEEDFMK